MNRSLCRTYHSVVAEKFVSTLLGQENIHVVPELLHVRSSGQLIRRAPNLCGMWKESVSLSCSAFPDVGMKKKRSPPSSQCGRLQVNAWGTEKMFRGTTRPTDLVCSEKVNYKTG